MTRANGVLSAYVQPTGGTIAGQGCVVDLDGWVPREMVMADRVALNVNIPAFIRPDPNAPRPSPGRGRRRAPEARQERLEAIKEQFRLALAYDKVGRRGEGPGGAPPVPDPRLAALAPYAKGEKPVIFRADRRDEILDALKIAKELKLKAIISGGAEAWKVAEELKAAEVPVLVGGTLRLPDERTDPYDAPYANPARLHEAGVTFAIRSGGRGPETRRPPAQPALRGGHRGRLRPARGGGLEGRDARPGPDPRRGRPGRLARGRQAGQPRHHGRPHPPADDRGQGPVHRRQAARAREPAHPALRQVRRRLAEVRAGTAPLGLDPSPPPVAEPTPVDPTPRPAGPR